MHELDSEKRKAAHRLNTLKATSLRMSSELTVYAAQNKSMKNQLRDVEYSGIEHSNAMQRELDRTMASLRESEAEVESLKISLENIGRKE